MCYFLEIYRVFLDNKSLLHWSLGWNTKTSENEQNMGRLSPCRSYRMERIIHLLNLSSLPSSCQLQKQETVRRRPCLIFFFQKRKASRSHLLFIDLKVNPFKKHEIFLFFCVLLSFFFSFTFPTVAATDRSFRQGHWWCVEARRRILSFHPGEKSVTSWEI